LVEEEHVELSKAGGLGKDYFKDLDMPIHVWTCPAENLGSSEGCAAGR
jgi:hypothetical protein